MSEKKRLIDYKEPNYFQDKIEISFNVFDSYCEVSCKSELTRRASGTSDLLLNGLELELLEIKLDDKPLIENQNYKFEKEDLVLLGLQEKHQLEIKTKIYPHKNKSMEGLYKTSNFYCTQNEAEGFRRITYFIDRPDNLASFRVNIEADKSLPVLLSNGDLVEEKELPNNRHSKTWVDPFKKPSYLFAVCMGDLARITDTYTTCSGREVKLEIYSEEKYLDRLDYSMQALKDSMKWDEDRFGLEYDLNTYMVVASDDFNSGAMENKGLNIFNTKFLLASPETATEENYYMIQSVVGHEYFHNWSGNRVTCRDWFQLSLKEGLTVFRDQEFTSDLNSRAVKRIEDVRLLRAAQFTEDAGPNSHPVRPPEVLSINNFYSMTIYEKGSELIRMLHTILGESKFQDAMKIYFSKHDGSAATCDDFVSAMEEASGLDLSHFKKWYSQSGTPILTINDNWDDSNKTIKIDFSQKTKPTNDQKTKEALYLPIRLEFFNLNGKNIEPKSNIKKTEHGDYLYILDKDEASLELSFEEEVKVSYLREFSSPVILEKKYSKDELEFFAKYDTDLFNRYEACQKILESQILALYEDDSFKPELSSFDFILKDYKKDPSFVNLAIQMPNLDYLMLQKSHWNFEKIVSAHKNLEQSFAVKFSDKLKDIYLDLEKETRGKSGLHIKGEKELAARCLRYLSLSQPAEAEKLAIDQISNNSDMAKHNSALVCIRNLESFKPEHQSFKDFRNKWKEDKLVFNNYLNLIAGVGGKLEKQWIVDLMEDEYFDFQNPNNLYNSLRIMISNPKVFHSNYEWSYQFVVEQLEKVDSFNPQVAGRIAGCLDSWNKFDETRKKLMHDSLSALSKKKISENLREIVENNLKLI